jgi:hypothetical protein
MRDAEARAEANPRERGRLLDLMERPLAEREEQVRVVIEAYWRGYEDGQNKGLGDRWVWSTVYAGLALTLLGAYLIVYVYQLVFR